MSPTDAGPGAGNGPGPRPIEGGTAVGKDAEIALPGDAEDTLELRLPDDCPALFPAPFPVRGPVTRPAHRDGHTYRDGHAHLDSPAHRDAPAAGDLLDGVADWGPVPTPGGSFVLVPVRIERDLALISRWMNDPAVAAFWQLAGPESVTAAHLTAQLDGDGRSTPCLGVLDGIPMSYFEIYRADLDPLARHYPARPHDTGIHLLIGGVTHRARGLGSTLLRAVADLVLDQRPRCSRVVAEPDLRNTPSVSAFLSGGFRFFAEVDLPGKRAAVLVRDRAHRDQL
ncbi:GNAT family N-acetyltransferase [Streptomyces sp. NPDC055078]